MGNHGRLGAVGVLLLGLLLSAAPALAHVTVNPGEAAPGYTAVRFRVPHGCEDGAATGTLRVQIPAGVASVKPELVHGWEVDTEVGRLDEPVQLHGEEVTEGVLEVAWSGPEIPDDMFKEFGLSLYVAAEPGSTLYFPAIQECVDGSETAWIEIPAEGQSRDDLEEPAPQLTVVEGGSHGAGDADAGTARLDAVGLSPVTAALTAGALAIAGLAMGIAAFVRSGQRT